MPVNNESHLFKSLPEVPRNKTRMALKHTRNSHIWSSAVNVLSGLKMDDTV